MVLVHATASSNSGDAAASMDASSGGCQSFTVTVFGFDDDRMKPIDSSYSTANCVKIDVGSHCAVLYNKDSNTETARLQLKTVQSCEISSRCFAISSGDCRVVLRFESEADCMNFKDLLNNAVEISSRASLFDSRTEESSAAQYFQFYGYLSQQQNMMQDYVRTYTYQRAMLSNQDDFANKIVLDVGAGSGILSFFAVQSGAKKVFAVEASSMAMHCQSLVQSNKLSGKITVIPGKIEEIQLDEKVDTIVSEPMGYMLINERMLETFLHAKKFLKPGGRMFPSRGDLHIVPFTDEALYIEQCSKANFWCQEFFHGVNVSSLRLQALDEYLRQPIVDTFDIRICMSKSIVHVIDFTTAEESDLYRIDVPLQFSLRQTGYIHGLAFWFDCAFIGSNETVWLSTSPTEPLTHWYQVRCLLKQPLLGRQGQVVTGRLLLVANRKQSYDVTIELTSGGITSTNTLDLKNPFFRYTGQAPVAVAANYDSSAQGPTDAYWQNMATDAAAVATNSHPQQFGAVPVVPDGVLPHPMYGQQAMDIAAVNGQYGMHMAQQPCLSRLPLQQAIPAPSSIALPSLHASAQPQPTAFAPMFYSVGSTLASPSLTTAASQIRTSAKIG